MRFLNPIEKRLNGKLNVVDFRYLKPADFKPVYNLEKSDFVKETVIVSPEGYLYINSRIAGSAFLADIFETLMVEKQYTLEQYQKICKQDYPDVTLENIADFDGSDSERTKIFAGLVVPVELQRRRMEKEYFSKIRRIK